MKIFGSYDGSRGNMSKIAGNFMIDDVRIKNYNDMEKLQRVIEKEHNLDKCIVTNFQYIEEETEEIFDFCSSSPDGSICFEKSGLKRNTKYKIIAVEAI